MYKTRTLAKIKSFLGIILLLGLVGWSIINHGLFIKEQLSCASIILLVWIHTMIQNNTRTQNKEKKNQLYVVYQKKED